jgi:hypothetical protein
MTKFVPLSWIRIHELRQTPALMHENVRQFCQGMITDNAPSFKSFPLEVDPHHTGFEMMNRPRLYMLLLHRLFASLRYDVFDVCEKVTAQMALPSCRIRDLFIAPKEEVLQEAQRLCSIRGLSYNCFAYPNMRFTLSPTEHKYVSVYNLAWWTKAHTLPELIPDLVYGLNDDPSNRLSWSAAGRLPTFRTGANRFFSPYFHRVLTLRERLCAMGMPMYQPLANACLAPIIEADSQMAGNAMHIPSAITAMTIALACTRLL